MTTPAPLGASIAALLLLLLASACGGATTPSTQVAAPTVQPVTAADAPPADSSAPAATTSPAAFPASADAGKISALKLSLPSGWTRETTDGGEMVTFDGPRRETDGARGSGRIDFGRVDVSTSPEAYLGHELAMIWDKGTTATIVRKEVWPGGFAATYRVKPAVDPTHASLTFIAVWDVGGKKLRCEGSSVPDETYRDAILAICKSAVW